MRKKNDSKVSPEVKVRRYFTPEELVKRWRGTPTLKTLANWRHLKKGPEFKKVGSKIVRYPVANVLRWEKASRK